MFPHNLAAQCQAAFIKSPVGILHFTSLWDVEVTPIHGCFMLLTQKTSNSSPWEQIPLWVNSTRNSKVGPKGHSFAPRQRDFSQNNPSQGSRQHGLLFSARSFIYKQKRSGEKIGLWQTCPQKKIWGQIFRCHKSAAVKGQR